MIIGLNPEEMEIFNAFIAGDLSELNALIHLYENSDVEVVEVADLDEVSDGIEVDVDQPIEFENEKSISESAV